MHMFSASPQRRGRAPVETGLTCPECANFLYIERTWRSVQLGCKACGRHFPVEQFIRYGDEALEQYLETVVLDRI